MKTYVFSAGASTHAHYPLSSNLWPSTEEWARRWHTYLPVIDEVDELFNGPKPFEALLSDLDDRISQTSDHTSTQGPKRESVASSRVPRLPKPGKHGAP